VGARSVKLNFVLPDLSLSGGIKVLLKVASGLHDRGHDVRVSAPGPVKEAVRSWLDPALPLTLIPRRPFVRRAALRGYRLVFREALSAHDEMRYLRQLVVDGYANVATAWNTAYPVVWGSDGLGFYYMQHYEPLLSTDPLEREQAELTYKLPLHQIANSSWLAEQLRQLNGRRPPVVLPAVEHDVYTPSKDGPAPPGVVMTFCDRRRWKGYADVIRAFDIVAQRRPDVRFAAFGTRPPHIRPEVAKVSYRTAPYGHDLANLYRSANLFVLGSWYESSPLQPLEAMACGVPVISTPYGLEDYARDGENVVLAPPRDPVRLAEIILETIGDAALLARLRRSGLETARGFTWQRTVAGAEAAFAAHLGN